MLGHVFHLSELFFNQPTSGGIVMKQLFLRGKRAKTHS